MNLATTRPESTNSARPAFRAPSTIERTFNRFFAHVLGLGVGPGYNWRLEVPGRKSGKIHQTPVNLMEHGGRTWLVCPRGRAQWVLNAEANGGRITLRRGRRARAFKLRELPITERAPLLREYLNRYPMAVQRYFTVDASAELEAFAEIADDHPVFELLEETAG